jgi:hypothetical protein
MNVTETCAYQQSEYTYYNQQLYNTKENEVKQWDVKHSGTLYNIGSIQFVKSDFWTMKDDIAKHTEMKPISLSPLPLVKIIPLDTHLWKIVPRLEPYEQSNQIPFKRLNNNDCRSNEAISTW